MNVTFKIDGVSFNKKLATYKVYSEVSYAKVITTIDNVERTSPGFSRPVVAVSFWPLTDAESAALYSALSAFKVTVEYTDPNKNQDVIQKMRLAGNLESAFALTGIDGNRRYIGGEIILRGGQG